MEINRDTLVDLFPPESVTHGHIWIMLVENALGPGNAVPARQLGDMAGVEDDAWQTVMRRILREMVTQSELPIVGSSAGYYVATDPNEVRQRANSLRSRAAEIASRADALDSIADYLEEALKN